MPAPSITDRAYIFRIFIKALCSKVCVAITCIPAIAQYCVCPKIHWSYEFLHIVFDLSRFSAHTLFVHKCHNLKTDQLVSLFIYAFSKKNYEYSFYKWHDFHFGISWKAVVFSPKTAVNTFLNEYNLHTEFAFLWPGVVTENEGIGNREKERLCII